MVAVAGRPIRSTLPEARGALARRARRVRAAALPIAQTALAAALAWALASLVNPKPFFAPISAVISLGVARGRRTTRAVELVLGVAVGIAVADVIVTVLGTGTLVVALVVALTMAVALLLGAGTLFVNQAAVSAILVATLQPPQEGLSPDRFVDALIGGAVALLVGQVLLPRDPLRAMADAARPVAEELARSLDATARALREGDRERAERALAVARGVDEDVATFFDAVAVARETVPVLPGRRPRERLPLYAEAAQRMDFAVRNTRVLCVRAVAAIRRGDAAPPELAEAIALLADAVRALGLQLAQPGGELEVRRRALRAAARATAVLRSDPSLSVVVMVGQVRSTAMDLLRGSGVGAEEARRALDAATEGDEPPTDVALRTLPPRAKPRTARVTAAVDGQPASMPTQPEPVTLSEVVHRAVTVADPDGHEGLDDLLARFEDDDEPLGATTAAIAEQRIAEAAGALDPQAEDPALQMAAAVATYLAFRRDEVGAGPAELLTLAARAEYDGDPPELVRAWLGERGIAV
jgi:hypothetical protein